jgi:hypothetical protein
MWTPQYILYLKFFLPFFNKRSQSKYIKKVKSRLKLFAKLLKKTTKFRSALKFLFYFSYTVSTYDSYKKFIFAYFRRKRSQRRKMNSITLKKLHFICFAMVLPLQKESLHYFNVLIYCVQCLENLQTQPTEKEVHFYRTLLPSCLLILFNYQTI